MRTDALATSVAVLERPPTFIVNPGLAAAMPATPAAKSGVKKLAFGKLTVKKEDTKTAYPVYAHPEAAVIAARIKTRKAEIKALEGAIQTDKADLKQSVGLFYFQVNHGKTDVPSSISVPSDAGEVLVSYTNRYSNIEDDSPIVAILGAERTEKYFRQTNEIKIACDQVPGDCAQEFVDELTLLLEKYKAVEAAATSSSIKPIKEFHTARHTALTVEENLALEGVIPIVTAVKTEGRGEKD